jgi:Mn-dependent DtxR family transcriptional regulator
MHLTLPSTFVERIHELSPGATKAYLALAWLKATKKTHPTQPEIAACMNASSRSVTTYLKELEDFGYLRKRPLGGGRRTDYILLTELTYGGE